MSWALTINGPRRIAAPRKPKVNRKSWDETANVSHGSDVSIMRFLDFLDD